MNLHRIPSLVAQDPTVAGAFTGKNGTLGCPEVARAVVLGAMASLHPQATFVVATSTGSAAAQLVDDLQVYLPANDVVLYPAWETLPFERISPNVETMGKRMEALWRLRTPEHRPRIVVAGARALLQKIAPQPDITIN